MAKIAVVAHRKKTLGGGLDELRRLLTDEPGGELLWYEVSKSRKARKKARKAVKAGAELIFVWGGDGMVQRCVDALAGRTATIAIIPAGTANLLAGNLGIPTDLRQAVDIGLHGGRRTLDLGKLAGEHFAVMAGAGMDGELIQGAHRKLKNRIGRLSYVATGLAHVRDKPVPMKIRVDGNRWFDGQATCVLLGNVGTITGGIEAFDDARPDDGWLEVGVTTAHGMVQWARTVGRMAAGRSDSSPFVRITRARRVKIELGSPVRYELDGGARGTTSRLTAKIVPGAITVCVPRSESSLGEARSGALNGDTATTQG